MKNLLPASLMKKPKTLEEFQEFFFYWEPNLPFTEHSKAFDVNPEYGPSSAKEDVKEFKLILWNARKIKKLTKSEMSRIYDLYRGYSQFELENGVYAKYKGWKDSDNPKDRKILWLNKEHKYDLSDDWLRD